MPQITRVRDSMDVPYKLTSNAEFETSYTVFKASRRCLARGIPSRKRIERIMRRVYGPQADPFQMGHERPLELPANSSPKHPWLAARARFLACFGA
jgi:hypothetical protein